MAFERKPRVAVTGASGFIGSHLGEAFDVVQIPRGLEVPQLVRLLKRKEVQGVINLAGAPIFGLWTPLRKRKILKSRIETTRRIVEAINQLPQIEHFISVSGIGIYPPNRECGEECPQLNRNSFLGQVAEQWEREAFQCNKPTAVVRLGVVFGEKGILPLLYRSFKARIVPIVGNGENWLSYISVYEVVKIFRFLFEIRGVGVYNGTTPYPVQFREVLDTMEELTGLHPLRLQIPPILLRWFLGGLVDEVLHDSHRVLPNHLLEKGYRFDYPKIRDVIEPFILEWGELRPANPVDRRGRLEI